MKHCCIGLLAHVDAGKTTLSEAILYRAGALRAMGRVDHGDTALDSHDIERRRGITIFSSQAGFDWGDTRFTLLDTPGHVDFSTEMERTLQVLDCAVLVISAADGVQAHTETLWSLLQRYGVPTVLFVTKMDLDAADRSALCADLHAHLGETIFDFTSRPDDETLAMCSDALLERYMDCGSVSDGDIARLIAERRIFPCYFGSGLKNEGVAQFLDSLCRYLPEKSYPEQFGARVFKISHDAKGERLTHLKLTGGTLKVRAPLRYTAPDGEVLEEKVNALRICSGSKFEAAEAVSAGEVCVLAGLSKSFAGQGLGFEPDASAPVLEPALSYRVTLPRGVDAHVAMKKLKLLEEEDPLLRFVWNERAQEIHVQLMGQVQIEVLRAVIAERFGLDVAMDAGSIQYKETIAAPVEGAGHYEPLRHYAEVHLLLEPLERGRGIELESDCSTDLLDLNWQRLILSHLQEKQHLGVLTGAPVTDLRITILSGKAHLKHTEGGDFRQATYRALRQGLMKAQSVLLEPYYSFRLEVPLAQTGRAISDVRAMNGEFHTESTETTTILSGTAPVSTMRDYAGTVAAYTGGRGKFSCCMAGYQPCHNAAAVIADIGYDPESDTENSPDSIFCAHGAGTVVKWDKADGFMHVSSGTLRGENRASPRPRMGNLSIDEKELEAIMEREFGPIRRPMYTKSTAPDRSAAGKINIRQKKELVIVDGYNVIFAWDELAAMAQQSLDGARHRLAEILVNYHGFSGNEVVLVFDAYAVKDGRGSKMEYHGLKVVFTKENESADLYIQKLLHDIGRNYAVRIITSDNLIRLSAIGSGVLRTSAREFGNEMDWVMGQIGEVLRKTEHGHGTKLTEAKL